MKVLKDKSTLFIIAASLLTLIILIVGVFVFSKDSSLIFSGDGYILSSNNKYYFKSGTTYKENLLNEYTFKDENNDDVSVEPASFAHYLDESILFMQNGALMDLNQITQDIVPYYNITNKSLIEYTNGSYKVTTATQDYNFQNWIGRISDNKYIVAGQELSLKLPGVTSETKAKYFELTFIEEGIVKIENQEVSYQTATEGTIIKVTDDISINLGTMTIYNKDDPAMTLSQITINGDENIDLEPTENNGKVDITDNDSETKDSNSNENTTNREESNQNSGTTTGETTENSSDNSNEENPSNASTEENNTIKNDATIKLLDAKVTSNSITAAFGITDRDSIKGNLILNIIDTKTNSKVYSKILDETSSTANIAVDNLSPDTNYLLMIDDVLNDNTIQLYQKSFRTEEIGLSLEKVYTTTSSLSYKLRFDKNTNIKSATITLYDENMNPIQTIPGVTETMPEEILFENLKSNTTYTAKIDSAILNGLEYINVYTISSTDITLKEEPDITNASPTKSSDSKNMTFYLQLKDVEDKDNSIVSYTYNIYEITTHTETTSSGETIEVEDTEKKLVKSIKQTSLDASIELTSKDIAANSNYKYNVTVEYNDNEKTRTKETGLSDKFFINADEPTVSFIPTKTTHDSVTGTLVINDKSCVVPVAGRTCRDAENSFELKYYFGSLDNETTPIYPEITSENVDENGRIEVEVKFTGLQANSGYIVELYGNTYLDGKLKYGLIDNSFSITTERPENLVFKGVKDNESTDELPINFDAILTSAKQDNEIALDKVTLKLYKENKDEKNEQIGETVTIDANLIFGANYNITNKTFGIENIDALKELCSNEEIQNTFTIEISDAIDAYGNKFEISNSTYAYKISMAYLLNQALGEVTLTANKITNESLQNPLENLSKSTIVGYELTAGLNQTKFLEIVGENGYSSINYYIYKIEGDSELLIKKDSSTKELTKKLYFEDIEEFNRGGKYKFTYDITLTNGEIYPKEQVTNGVIYTPEKESANYQLFVVNSNDTSITYRYSIKDNDNAISKEEEQYNFSLKKNEEVTTLPLTADGEYHDLVIDNLTNDENYSLSFKEELTVGEITEKIIAENTFEGYNDIANANVNYNLVYSQYDNRLAIKLEENNFLKRIVKYNVILTPTDNSLDPYTETFYLTNISTCPDSEDKCLIVDYANIKEYKGKPLQVTVEAFYENGYIGLEQVSEYGFTFKSPENTYLNLTENGFEVLDYVKVPQKFIYDKETNTMKISTEQAEQEVNLSYLSNGVLYHQVVEEAQTDYGIFDPKALANGYLSTEDNNFQFDSIIPKFEPLTESTISTIRVTGNITGMTVNSLSDYKQESDGNYYLYGELFESIDSEEPIDGKQIQIPLTIEDSQITVGTGEFTDLLPETTYYYKIYTYTLSNGQYNKVQVFDGTVNCIECSNNYIKTTYSAATLNASQIYSKMYIYHSSASNNETYSNRNLTMRVDFLNKENFEIAYELWHDETLVLSSGKQDGKTYCTAASGSTCKTSIGSLTNTKYMSVVTNLPEDFVYGNDYYTLKIYVIANNTAKSQLLIYENLLTTRAGASRPTSPSEAGAVYMNPLEDPTFEVVPQASTSTQDGMPSYDISVTVKAKDTDKTIIDGLYRVRIEDENHNLVAEWPELISAKTTQSPLVFTGSEYGLKEGTRYYIVVEADVYKNNVGVEDPYSTVISSNVVYTTSSSGISLGSPVATATATSLTIAYIGSSNLENIDKIDYTIYSNGGSGGNPIIKTGSITKTSSTPIFSSTIESNTTVYRLSINSLSLSKGTYSIVISYQVSDGAGGYTQLYGGNVSTDFIL